MNPHSHPAAYAPERALLYSCLGFTCLALAMIIGPFVMDFLLTSEMQDGDRALRTGIAFFVTYGFGMLAVCAFSCLASWLMFAVTWIFAREALRSRHGYFLAIANLIILGYAIFFLSHLF